MIDNHQELRKNSVCIRADGIDGREKISGAGVGKAIPKVGKGVRPDGKSDG